MNSTTFLTPVEHPLGKKYRRWIATSSESDLIVMFSEDSRCEKNWNNGSYYYVPSGFIYTYIKTDGSFDLVGNMAYDYILVDDDTTPLIECFQYLCDSSV